MAIIQEIQANSAYQQLGHGVGHDLIAAPYANRPRLQSFGNVILRDGLTGNRRTCKPGLVSLLQTFPR
jgi:hypothetical protein